MAKYQPKFKLKVPGDARCTCGWELPLSVMPIEPRSTEHDAGNIVPGVAVALMCPRCKRPHSFYTPDVAKNFGVSIGD